ncbi:MAG: FtsH protease activity modulator HflK [Alphaproteobacteria bacterium]|nr:MAG: FtsH protease activity modulator HflK [Alphaproteobacteria bacterium]
MFSMLKPKPTIHQVNPWGDPPPGDNNKGSSSGWGRKESSRGNKPGGGNNGGGLPPDFEDMFRKAMPPVDGKKLWGMIALAVFALWILSGVYSVSGGEEGVVLRFGKFDRKVAPGLHMHLPFPIETVLKPNTGIVNQIDVGVGSSGQSRRELAGTSPAGQMLTQDRNILNMHFRIMWRIDDPVKFLFQIRDPQATIRAAGESIMRELVGQRTFDNIVRGGREELGLKAKEMLQSILDSYGAGVLIVDVLPQKIDPPAEVIDAFNDVQRAEQDAEREINQAEAYRSDIVPRARGEAEKIKLDAAAYKEQVVREAEGEAQGFVQVYNAYKASSDLTAKRLYIETMQEILKKSSKIYVDGKAVGNVVPFLPLQDLMKRPNVPGNNQPAEVQ